MGPLAAQEHEDIIAIVESNVIGVMLGEPGSLLQCSEGAVGWVFSWISWWVQQTMPCAAARGQCIPPLAYSCAGQRLALITLCNFSGCLH